MKKLIVVMIVLVSTVSLIASRLANEPKFDSPSINMSSNGGLCGGLTIDPLTHGDDVVQARVQSWRSSESLLGALKPGKPLSDWVQVPVAGLRVAYDWAGPRPSFHYRIYCQMKNERGEWVSVDCKRAVTIRDVQHNRPCVWGPAGANASYEPLNMKIR